MYPQKYGDAVQNAGWMPLSVKSPFERKPGMKMSTYGGDKRKDKIRNYLHDSFLPSHSPYSVDDQQDSLLQQGTDDMDEHDIADVSQHQTGEAPFTNRKNLQKPLKLKVTSTDKAMIARQLDQFRFN